MVRVILVLWVFLVDHRVREIEEGTNVLRGGVGVGGSVGIGRNGNLSSNVPTGSSWCRMFFCDVSRVLP